MVRRWILYGLSLICCIVFFLAYQAWFSWFALVFVLCIPVAALILSLPAMTLLQLSVGSPGCVNMHTPVTGEYTARGRLPAPPVKCGLRVTRTVTGENWLLKEGAPLPTDHCGQLSCSPDRAYIYDYLGLFRLKCRRWAGANVTVWPETVPITNLPELTRHRGRAWRPKPGGGFAENHEMRLYRPGDKLNQIHWKLSAKTGKFIVREPMEPVRDAVRVEMVLRGTAEELDKKFGQLLWLCLHLLEQDTPHEVRVLTGKGIRLYSVENGEDLNKAVTGLLAEPPAQLGQKLEPLHAAWLYRIGGGEDEA